MSTWDLVSWDLGSDLINTSYLNFTAAKINTKLNIVCFAIKKK